MAHNGYMERALALRRTLRAELELRLCCRICVNVMISSIVDFNEYHDIDKDTTKCCVALCE